VVLLYACARLGALLVLLNWRAGGAGAGLCILCDALG
jgi:hypothetical protein